MFNGRRSNFTLARQSSQNTESSITAAHPGSSTDAGKCSRSAPERCDLPDEELRDQPHGRIRPTRAARAEQDKERDNSCAILGEQDKTKDAGGAAPQVITNAALFIGDDGAWLLVFEFFAWRVIKNRRELASLAGLTPTPYASGESRREQGISKAGNRRVRFMITELAWGWLRYQPESELSQWYMRRFGRGNKRLRKVGIMALARKLLIAL